MGHPMVPKITILVRSQAARRPSTRFPAVQRGGWRRAVSGSRAPALRRQAVRCGSSFRHAGGSSSGTRAETARHDGSFLAPGCCPATPLGALLLAAVRFRRCSGRQADKVGTARSTGPVRRRAARCARRGLSRSHAGDPVPGHGSFEPLRVPRTLRPSSRGHNDFFLSSPHRRWASGRFAPRHYRIPADAGSRLAEGRDFARHLR